jgi:hypothetical protein
LRNAARNYGNLAKRIKDIVNRRVFLKSAGAAVLAACNGLGPSLGRAAEASTSGAGATPKRETYATQAKGLRILPGQWRPHYPWEHIVWIIPSWPSQDYLWLDFPDAIFTNRGLLFLSHINPDAPAVYADWPRVEWRTIPGGIGFERRLPDGVSFGGSVTKAGDSAVALELRMKNDSGLPLTRITLQTCAFLRAIREFADYTQANKFVHVPGHGWVGVPEASKLPGNSAPYRLGWRTSGKRLADWPVMATISNTADRLVAMTWHKDTLSMVSNPMHPCMHADPQFKDLQPGESSAVHGKILFFEGKLADFDYARDMGVAAGA